MNIRHQMTLHTTKNPLEPTDDLILFIRNQIREYENKLGSKPSINEDLPTTESESGKLRLDFMSLCASN